MVTDSHPSAIRLAAAVVPSGGPAVGVALGPPDKSISYPSISWASRSERIVFTAMVVSWLLLQSICVSAVFELTSNAVSWLLLQ